LLTVLAASCLLAPGPARAVGVSCDTQGGESAGWSVATGGDFDGDGTKDIAVGAPCARVGEANRAGVVRIHSGVDGKRIFVVQGEQPLQRLGGAIAFVPDLSGDGIDDLVVGSSAWDVEMPQGGTRVDTGKIELFSIDGGSLFAVEGQDGGGSFGESVSAVDDVDGDDKPDIVVGAGGDEIDGVRFGKAYLVSGADGQIIDVSDGTTRFDSWGSVVVAAGDRNGDDIEDILISSNIADAVVGGTPENPVTVSDAGVAKLVSGADMQVELAEVMGMMPGDKVGRSITPAGQLGFFVGAPGTDPSNKSKAGSVMLYDWTGALQMEFHEPDPKVAAAFGRGVASPDDIDDDGTRDFVASSVGGPTDGVAEAGRVHAISSETGNVIWSIAGDVPQQKLGHVIAAAPDYDRDGVKDLVVGAPGAAPKGRRGAGAAYVISGADGSELMELGGRRGLETRVFVAGWNADGRARVRGFSRKGRGRALRANAFRRLADGDLSVAVLDEGSPAPNTMQVVVGTGHGADDDTVEMFRVGRRRSVLRSTIEPFDASYSGGVNVAVGNVATSSDREIVVAQADSADGAVDVSIFEPAVVDQFGRVFWGSIATFPAFAVSDTIDSFPVNAEGANVAVGNVLAGDIGEPFALEEIVVAPIGGLPSVRVLSSVDGATGAEWTAFAPDQNSGVSVAVANLGGSGMSEIITAPYEGFPWVRVFNGDGTPFRIPGTNDEVSFFAFDIAFEGGIRVGAADVDLDGAQEILVASGPGMPGSIKAFELDGTEVEGISEYFPFGRNARRGLAFATTDRYIRH
jgi:hypothetical protein